MNSHCFHLDALPIYALGHCDANWNGAAVPFFNLAEGQLIALHNNQCPENGTLRYCVEQDAFVFDAPDGECTVFSATVKDGQTLYSIGGYSWIWLDMSTAPEGRRVLDLITEFDAMRAAGLTVPDKAYLLARTPAEVEETFNMSVSGAADLMIQLATLE